MRWIEDTGAYQVANTSWHQYSQLLPRQTHILRGLHWIIIHAYTDVWHVYMCLSPSLQHCEVHTHLHWCQGRKLLESHLGQTLERKKVAEICQSLLSSVSPTIPLPPSLTLAPMKACMYHTHTAETQTSTCLCKQNLMQS